MIFNISQFRRNDEIDEICQSLSSPLCHFVENRFLRGDLSFEDTSPKLWGRVLGSSPACLGPVAGVSSGEIK